MSMIRNPCVAQRWFTGLAQPKRPAQTPTTHGFDTAAGTRGESTVLYPMRISSLSSALSLRYFDGFIKCRAVLLSNTLH